MTSIASKKLPVFIFTVELVGSPVLQFAATWENKFRHEFVTEYEIFLFQIFDVLTSSLKIRLIFGENWWRIYLSKLTTSNPVFTTFPQCTGVISAGGGGLVLSLMEAQLNFHFHFLWQTNQGFSSPPDNFTSKMANLCKINQLSPSLSATKTNTRPHIFLHSR